MACSACNRFYNLQIFINLWFFLYQQRADGIIIYTSNTKQALEGAYSLNLSCRALYHWYAYTNEFKIRKVDIPMIHFNKKKLIDLARLSALELDNEEIEKFEKDITLLLGYLSELELVVQKKISITTQRTNIFRDDNTIIQYESKDILKQAPKTEGTYFVVPKIL